MVTTFVARPDRSSHTRALRVVVLGPLLAACASVSGGPRMSEVASADSAARAAIANERSLDVSSFPKGAIAVVPFRFATGDRELEPLAYGLADLLATDLARSSQLNVVDRLRIGAVLRELDLVAAGRVDTAAAPRVGRLVGARQLIGGDVSAFDRRLQLSPTIADVSTAQWRFGSAVSANVEGILDAEKELAFGIFADLGVNLSPAERMAIEQRPTKQLGALLAYSQAVKSEAAGDYTTAVSFYRSAASLDPEFVLAGSRLSQATQRARESQMISSRRKEAKGAPSRAMGLAGNAVNPSAFPAVADALDPAFARARHSVPIVILVNIP